MESKISLARRLPQAALVVLMSLTVMPEPVWAQERAVKGEQAEAPHLELRRTARSREYQGRTVDGEDRVVRRGDSLWRILIQERGLPQKGFSRYVILIGSLNPGLKNPDVLPVGDTLFIPMEPDEILGVKPAVEKEETKGYRVKQGDRLYDVLREQLEVKGGAELRKVAEQVKRLNPDKKNWDSLLVGETIRLHAASGGVGRASAVPKEKPVAIVGLDYGQKISAQENLDLLASVMEALGQETSREGEEAVALSDGTVHLDRAAYPVIQNSKRGQKIILDLQSKISQSLRSKLETEKSGLPVVSLKKGASLHETVNNLLSRLGYQSLPSNQPVVVQDQGVAVQVKGEWMAMPQEEGGAAPQVVIISLTDDAGQAPAYLREYLALKGMNLKEIALPSSRNPVASPEARLGDGTAQARIESWPADKAALIDAFLNDYDISFAGESWLSVTLRDGIRIEAKADRLFEYGGKKVALSFRPVGDDVKKALQQSQGVRVVELNPATQPSREVIGKLLTAVGEAATYREQRFQANDRGPKDKLTLAISGYYLTKRSLLLTDREIPKELERFFSDKGMRVVRFR